MDNDQSWTDEFIRELNDAHIAYERLLGRDLEDTIVIALAHGWRSTNYERGIAARERIAKAQQMLGLK